MRIRQPNAVGRSPLGPPRRGGRAAVSAWIAVFAVLLALVGDGRAQSNPSAPAPEGRKVVGLVFDDSGSMRNRIQLPAFAAQLLVSSLDPARDRLFTLRLSTWLAAAKEGDVGRLLDRGVDPATMGRLRVKAVPDLPRDEFARAAPDRIIDRIRAEWPVARSDTPFGPIELMLETLTAEAAPGDVVHLVVLTDGKFEPDPPDVVTLRRDFEQYRARLRAPLHVDFILIAPGDEDGEIVRGEVERQGVRRTLATVFEGEPERRCGAGACNDVSTSRDLYRVVFDVVARINQTDRGSPGRDTVVRVADRRLTLDSPLSVSRIVGITFAPAGDVPPSLTATSFGGAPTLTLDSSMALADSAAGWRDERNAARSVQFNLATALPPGPYVLDFDRPLGDRHLFLFDTAARFRLAVRDAEGNPLPAGRGGVPEVVRGQSIRIAATVVDRVAGRDVEVDWAGLGRARLAAFVDAPDGDRAAVTIGPDVIQGARVGTFTPTRLGTHAIGGSLTLDGFVRKEAQRPQFRVVDGAVAPNLAIRAVDCPDCRPGTLRTRLEPGVASAVVGEVDVRVGEDRSIPFTVDLSGSPNWLTLVDRAGAPVPPGRVLRGDDQGRLGLRLVRTIETPDEPVDHDRPVALRVAAVAPWSGEARAAATLRVEVPLARLEHVGDTAGGGPDDTLKVDGDDLSGGRNGARFELKGTMGFTPRREDFSVATRSTWVDWDIEASGNAIVVRPVRQWCRCGVWWFGIPPEVELVYRGFGETRATASMVYAPTWWQGFFDRLFCIGSLPILIGLAGMIVAYARAPRFPKGSYADIRRRNQPIRASEPLRRWDGEGNWRCVRYAITWRSRPARHTVEGLHLEAAYGGFRLLLASTNEAVKVESQGRTVKTIREENTRLEALPLPWNSAFAERRTFEQLVVRRG